MSDDVGLVKPEDRWTLCALADCHDGRRCAGWDHGDCLVPKQLWPADGDLGLAPERHALDPAALQHLGALSLEFEQSEAIDRVVMAQEDTYRQILREQGPEPLIAALLARDRQLAQQGREMADGRSATRLLREVMRGLLQRSDHAQLRAIGDATKTGTIAAIVDTLSGETTDARQLKLHGSTLGPLADPQAHPAASLVKKE